MSDPRVAKFAKVLVEHSARIVPGDRVLIEATTAAEPLVRELYVQILEKGGIPHPMIAFPGMMPFSQDEMYLTYAKDAQLDFVPTFYKMAYDQFESRIRVHSATNTRGTTTRQGAEFDHRLPDATRRRRCIQMGDNALPHRWIRPGRGHEFERIRRLCFQRCPCTRR